MGQSELQIGDLAARTGVSIDTVRYYERRRLLPPASRTGGGYRLFPAETVERIRFIKQAQGLGFTLDEIGQLLSGDGKGAEECRDVRDLLRAKLSELDERMTAMREFRKTLARQLAACESELDSHGEAAACPVMVEITHVERPHRGSKEKRK